MIDRVTRWLSRKSPYRDDDRAVRQQRTIDEAEELAAELRSVRLRIERERWLRGEPTGQAVRDLMRARRGL